jgi:hypothetical protein
MYLVLSQDQDNEAVWLAGRLRELGLAPLELVTAGDLAGAISWEHRVGNRGNRTVVRLADGRTLDSTAVGPVFNRLTWIWPAAQGVPPADLGYAAEELRALALSWIQSLGPLVINRPVPPALASPSRVAWHWRWLACQAGVPVLRYRTAAAVSSDSSPMRSRLIIDGEPVPGGSGEAPVMANLDRLGAAVDIDVFEATFVGDEGAEDGGWALASLDPMPPLSSAGDRGVGALAAAMRRRSGVPA